MTSLRSALRESNFAARAFAAAVALVAGAAGLHQVANTGAAPGKEPAVSPDEPKAMAVGPNGDLYVVDTGRDKILERLSDGQWRVVAGTGREGFSGDGGPADKAEIGLGYASGIAVAPSGSVYFSDSGNLRVQEVTPAGVIRTVAGGGTKALGRQPVPALGARLGSGMGSALAVEGLTINPQGQLDIGLSAGVYRLGPGHKLYWVAGAAGGRGSVAWDANPGNESDLVPAARLVYDGRGDLYVGGGGGWGLYELKPGGDVRFVAAFRGAGAGYWGSVAATPSGDVVGVSNAGIERVGTTGRLFPLTSSPAALQTALNRAMGYWPPGSKQYGLGFVGGEGIAVGRDGTIYVDMSGGGGRPPVSAILAVTPAGKVSTVWRSD